MTHSGSGAGIDGSAPGFELEGRRTPIDLRYIPESLRPRIAEAAVAEYLNELNQAIQSRMERGGEAFVSNAVLGDVYALRMCVVNFRTTLEDVTALAEITARLGRTADQELRPPGLR